MRTQLLALMIMLLLPVGHAEDHALKQPTTPVNPVVAALAGRWLFRDLYSTAIIYHIHTDGTITLEDTEGRTHDPHGTHILWKLTDEGTTEFEGRCRKDIMIEVTIVSAAKQYGVPDRTGQWRIEIGTTGMGVEVLQSGERAGGMDLTRFPQ